MNSEVDQSRWLSAGLRMNASIRDWAAEINNPVRHVALTDPDAIEYKRRADIWSKRSHAVFIASVGLAAFGHLTGRPDIAFGSALGGITLALPLIVQWDYYAKRARMAQLRHTSTIISNSEQLLG